MHNKVRTQSEQQQNQQQRKNSCLLDETSLDGHYVSINRKITWELKLYVLKYLVTWNFTKCIPFFKFFKPQFNFEVVHFRDLSLIPSGMPVHLSLVCFHNILHLCLSLSMKAVSSLNCLDCFLDP